MQANSKKKKRKVKDKTEPWIEREKFRTGTLHRIYMANEKGEESEQHEEM